MHASISRDPIEPTRLLAGVGDAGDGAALLFLGTVRDHNDARPVVGLRYDAYVSMAEEVLRAIAAEAGASCGTDRIAVTHRVGELAVGEVSVAIAVAAPHRAETFAACRYIIEEIKRRLPVWKEERYADAGARWLDGEYPPVVEPAP